MPRVGEMRRWSFFERVRPDPSRKEIGSNLLFALNYLPDATPEYVAEQHAVIASEIYPAAVGKLTAVVTQTPRKARVCCA